MMVQVSENMLREIDNLELSDRIRQWQKAIKGCPSQIYVDRQRLALESWKETEGEDIEIRRAKLFKKIVENVPIKIHDFELSADTSDQLWNSQCGDRRNRCKRE
jgi:pyruvate-formate lyase